MWGIDWEPGWGVDWGIMPAALACLALLIEALVGYPDRLAHAIGHPVTWMGRLIGLLDIASNRESMSAGGRRAAGAVALVIVVVVAAAVAHVLERGLVRHSFGLLLAAILASTLLAQRSLHDHVSRVAAALEAGGLAAGREAAGVARAAIESLAENFSDGVVAPAFWLAVAGLAGGAAYKAINTADSMIGHRTPRHKAFGWAAARLDDLVNMPASRLSALLIIGAAWSAGVPPALSGKAGGARDARAPFDVPSAWRAVIRDAPRHRSPNAGYPEAAMAGALGLALAGPRVYGGVQVDDAVMGNGRRDATAADIRAALALYRRADAMLIGLVAVLALAAIG
jgi:adenosylcobinamide-phosphate synthase